MKKAIRFLTLSLLVTLSLIVFSTTYAADSECFTSKYQRGLAALLSASERQAYLTKIQYLEKKYGSGEHGVGINGDALDADYLTGLGLTALVDFEGDHHPELLCVYDAGSGYLDKMDVWRYDNGLKEVFSDQPLPYYNQSLFSSIDIWQFEGKPILYFDNSRANDMMTMNYVGIENGKLQNILTLKTDIKLFDRTKEEIWVHGRKTFNYVWEDFFKNVYLRTNCCSDSECQKALQVQKALVNALATEQQQGYKLREVTDESVVSTQAMKKRIDEDFELICSGIADGGLFTREDWKQYEFYIASYYMMHEAEEITDYDGTYGWRLPADIFYAFLKREYGIEVNPSDNTYYDQYGNGKYSNGYYFLGPNGRGVPYWSTTIDHVYELQPNLYYVQLTESTSIEGGEPYIFHSYVILHQDKVDHYQLYECGKSATISPARLQYRLSAQAAPTGMRVTLDGNPISLEAYEIGGNNYVKLRDIAMLLNGTDKQFAVGYDSKTKAISLRTNESYTPIGGERKAPGSQTKLAAPTTSVVLLDGKALDLTAYEIGGNNFFKLRDLGQALDFGVKWNSGASTVEITSRRGYDGD